MNQKNYILKSKLIKALKKNNYFYRKTSEYLNCSKSVIGYLIKKYNIKWDKKKTRSENIREMCLGKHHSRETIRKISESNKGIKRVKFTKEIKLKMSESHKGKKHTEKTKRKIGDKNSIDFNKAKKTCKHRKIIRKYGKADRCEYCKIKKAKRYDWANINHKYNEDIDEWIRLCRSCHFQFDKCNKISLKQIKQVIKERSIKIA